MEYGIWSMEYAVWSMEYGVWNMEYGVRSMEYAVWNMEHGGWNMEYGVWSMERAKHSFCDLPNPLSCSAMIKIILNQNGSMCVLQFRLFQRISC